MEFLSLEEPIERPSLKVSRSEGILLSFGLHLLLLLMLLFGRVAMSKVLPESVLAFLSPQTPAQRARAQEQALASGAIPSPTPPNTTKVPLKFAYVSVPNDVATKKNPNAPLLSDKNRRARQEVPTPKDVKHFSIDPHSEGTSIDRVKPDPNRPTGREDVEAQRNAPHGGPTVGKAGQGASAVARDRGAQAAATPRPEGLLRSGESPGAESAGETSAPGEPSAQEQPGTPEGTGAPGEESRETLKQALSNLKSGEYKFQFNNPAYLRGGSYGTMSFDTQGFPWGDYARRIYLVIRNNWYERIPLAAREGIRGWVCQRFVIEKDGTISSIRAVRPSGIPPFDKSSADALSASSALPPLPQEFPEPSEGVTFCFYYNMVPGEESE